MYKRIILLLLICTLILTGFAQKNKRKSNSKAPKNDYFVVTATGCGTQENTFCPDSTVTFDFIGSPDVKIIKYWWKSIFHIGIDTIFDTKPVSFEFGLSDGEPTSYRVKLYIKYEVTLGDSVQVLDTLIYKEIMIDYAREKVVVEVCRGKDVKITTNKHGDFEFFDIQSDINSIPLDTLTGESVSGCDSLVQWTIKMKPYLPEEYTISSCDSVIWGVGEDKIIIKRPLNHKGDYDTTVSRIIPSNMDDICDTEQKLNVIIIDSAKLQIIYDKKAFCAGDDKGTVTLETNFTAFDWTYIDRDSLFTILQEKELKIDIENTGYYHVLAYMDTSLYDTLKDLRIVNCFFGKDTLLADCDLIIPDVITPNDKPDGRNDVFGIKKLNPAITNELTIYDRWGKIVFQQKNYKCFFKKEVYYNVEKAFKGISRGGQKLPDGTYNYAFKYASRPKNKTYTGILMIIR